jgi:hypothetical protein
MQLFKAMITNAEIQGDENVIFLNASSMGPFLGSGLEFLIRLSRKVWIRLDQDPKHCLLFTQNTVQYTID